ncbi:MAG: hypothetical protein NTZ69_11190 [Bacteroidia bacterium]|nr:hypothetical protein [Bacteroidia bacterium]
MKNRTTTFLLSLMIVLMISWTPSEKRDPLILYDQIDRSSNPNTLTSVEKKKGWNLLFDGKTTSGWHGFNLKGFPDYGKFDVGHISLQNHGTQVWYYNIKPKKFN